MEAIVKRLMENHNDELILPRSIKEDKGFGSFKAGDVCIYHFSGVLEDVPEKTKEYYKAKDGAYCFVTDDKMYMGMVQIRFPEDLVRGDMMSAECYPEDLEKVSK